MDQFGLERRRDPRHRAAGPPFGRPRRRRSRRRLAEAAFPGRRVELDPYPRTVDLLRARAFGDAILLIGADQYRDFPTWKEPEAVLERVRLGVATRSGLSAAPASPAHESRVRFFEIEPVPVSRTLCASAARAESRSTGSSRRRSQRLVDELGLYREG